MAKRRADSGQGVSLFPFLSILACIIGCLTMVIVALSIVQVKKKGHEPEEVERAKRFVKLQEEKNVDTRRIDELKALIESIVLNREEINKKREELKRIESMLDKSLDVEALRDELIAELNRLKLQLEELMKDHETLVAQIEELKKLMAEKKLKPDLPAVVVRPTGSGIGLRPFFAEVTSAAVLLHRKIGEDPIRVPIASLASDENFLQTLEAVKKAPNGQLIFLIRGDGISAYNRARAIANRAEARNAKLPLAGQGTLDLRMFEQFLQ